MLRSVSFEITPGVYDMIDMNKTVNDFFKVYSVTEDIRNETNSKTEPVLRFDDKSLFKIALGLAPNWDSSS